jgi:AcrR family transcriptional regulator
VNRPAALPDAPASDAAGSGKREATKAANRTAILTAARAVFADLGYGAATVRDIVRRTDLATGTFYNYFPDKESVLRAVLAETAVEVRRRLREARADASSLEEFVGSGYRAYFSFLVEDRASFDLMRRNAGTLRAMFDEPMLGAGLTELVDDLRDAVQRGALPPLDIDYVAAAMFGAGFEIGVRMLEREPPDVDGATAFVTALFLGGLERLR